MTGAVQYDLVVLVPDIDTEATIRALIQNRTKDLGIHSLRLLTVKATGHDPACFGRAHDFLRAYIRIARHALVVFDHEGSGQHTATPEAVVRLVEDRLSKNGWSNERAQAVVIAPELEQWLWTPKVDAAACLGWTTASAELREWLRAAQCWPAGDPKPRRPKETMQAVLKHTRRHRSAAIYAEFAMRADLAACEDPAFKKLTNTLRGWFPAGKHHAAQRPQ